MVKQPRTRAEPPRILSVGGLTGVPVVSLRQEKLGRVEEIMIDTGCRRVTYAILSFGALGGMGDRLFPVPWHLLRLDSQGEQFILQLVRERLKTAPGFSPRDWPRMSDRQWAREIHEFYSERPYWEEGRPERRSGSGRRATDRQGGESDRTID